MRHLVYNKKNNVETFPEYEKVTYLFIEELVKPIAQNLFSMFPENDNYENFVKQLYDLGSMGDPYFWVDQACQRLMSLDENAHRILIVNNEEEVKFLTEERGDFVEITREELDKLPEVIDELRRSINETENSEAVE